MPHSHAPQVCQPEPPPLPLRGLVPTLLQAGPGARERDPRMFLDHTVPGARELCPLRSQERRQSPREPCCLLFYLKASSRTLCTASMRSVARATCAGWRPHCSRHSGSGLRHVPTPPAFPGQRRVCGLEQRWGIAVAVR